MIHDQCIRELARFFRREGLNIRTWLTATIVVCLVMIYGALAHAEPVDTTGWKHTTVCCD